MIKDIKTRKVSIAELFRFGFQVFKKNPLNILLITIIASVPYHIIMTCISSDLAFTQQDILSQNFEKILKYLLIMIGVNVLFAPLATAGYTYIAKQMVEDEPVKFTGVLDSSLIKWHRHIFASLIFFGIIFIGSFLIFPAIYFGVVFTFYISIIAITDKKGIKALTASKKLVEQNFFYTLGIMTLMSFVAAIALIFLSVFSMAISNIENEIVVAIINVFYFTFLDFSTCVFQIMLLLYFLNLFYLKSEKKIEE